MVTKLLQVSNVGKTTLTFWEENIMNITILLKYVHLWKLKHTDEEKAYPMEFINKHAHLRLARYAVFLTCVFQSPYQMQIQNSYNSKI